ncbi:MAG: selenium-dependent xanthine dehydrogenase [Eubacteriales bacterium]|nr:selenium-dependent xanthine dehydrogenase [Eubacteriales bacterium]
MATFTVNGKQVTVEKNQKLIRYLRDTLRLTSVKDGCSEGACGTCTILIDGKATKCCVQQTDKMEGKNILTVEGLSPFEKEMYTYAFGEAGAVQCGFCIPGMVICAKGLLDVNPDPTEEDIRYAIRNNICRCTGYVKIVKAIRIAAEIQKSGVIPQAEKDWRVGKRVHRIDVEEKVQGYGQYPDDVYVEGMAYGSAVRTAHPRAKILAVHTEEAKKLPGVLGVYTAEDIPGNRIVGHLCKDWDALVPVGEITRYLGDAICLVAAETQEILEQAKKLVQIDYEVLTPIRSPYEAMADGAPKLHENGNLLAHKHVSRGNAVEAIKHSAHTLTLKMHTPYTEHAFLEPECAVAIPEEDGVLIYTADQGVYDTLHETAPMLGLKPEQVHVENKLVGGGFGGKEDVTVQHHAALLAVLTRRPVKVKLTRAESIIIHPKRHPMDMEFTLGCDENGLIQGVKAKVIADTGAYASLGGPVLERACTHASGPYNYQNFEIDGYAYYTNNPPAGAFRGFGVSQTCLVIETALNQMADKIGIDHWEIRYRNAIRPGQELPNGQIVGACTGLVETLEAVKEPYFSNKYTGIACAMKNAGVGVGIPDTGRVKLVIENGKVHIRTGASCIGQGLGTVLVQFTVEATGLDRERIVYERSNTFQSPDSGTTSGSRQTLITGEACRRAAVKLKADMDAGKTLEALDGTEYYAEYLAKTDPLGADVPNPVSHVAYGYATQIAILDENGMLKKMIAAHDVGKAVNPTSVEGQIEGGCIMSAGFALTEHYPLIDCRPTAKYGTLGLFRAANAPEVEAVVVEKPGLEVAYGAIGVGEITSIPGAPAILDAYHSFDGVWRDELPLKNTPYCKK